MFTRCVTSHPAPSPSVNTCSSPRTETVMRCRRCRMRMTEHRGDHPFREAGLDRVILLDVDAHGCDQCGWERVDPPRRELLQRKILDLLLSKPSRLIGSEIRYLRRSQGWTGRELARRMGVTPVTVSRWETGTREIGLPADRFLRLLVALALQAPLPALDHAPCPALNHVGATPRESLAAHLAWNGVDWVVVGPETTECSRATGAAP